MNQYRLNMFLSRVGLETGLPNWQLEPLRSLYILCIFRVLYTPSSLSDITKPRNLGVSGSEKSLLERISMFFSVSKSSFETHFWYYTTMKLSIEMWTIHCSIDWVLQIFFCNWAQLRGQLVNRKSAKETLEYKKDV